MRTIVLLAIKDVRLLMRDRVGAFFTFAFPVLYALLFGLMFSGSGEGSGTVGLAIIDEDRTDGSRAFVERLVDSAALEVTLLDDRDAGTELVRLGRRSASLVLPPGFGSPASSLLRGEPVVIEGVIDPSRKPEAAILRGTLQGLVFRHLTETMADPQRADALLAEAREAVSADASPQVAAAMNLMLSGIEGLVIPGDLGGPSDDETDVAGAGSLADGPVMLSLTELASGERNTPTTAFALTFAQGAAWGLMACALGSSLSLVSERSRGTLVRLNLAPVYRWQILAGKALGCFVTSMAMLALLVAFVHLPMFGVRPTSYMMLLVASSCSCAAFVGVMMLVASFGRTIAAVEGFGRAVLLVLALAGGAAVPVVFMPDWMRTIAGLSPFRWAIEAFDGAVWRGFGPSEMLVPCVVLLAIGGAGFCIGAAMFRFGRGMGE